MKNVYDVLDKLNIEYEKHEHPAVYTVEEAEQYDRGIDAGKSKNLFLRNKKGNSHYLLITESNKRIDFKKLSSVFNESRLSFASPKRLNEYLGLTPGAVSPFGLINNKDKSVRIIIDKDLLKYPKLGYHPNVNNVTLVIKTYDFKKYLDWTGNKVTYIDI